MKTRPKRKKISQAEARRLRRQVEVLQQRLQDQIHPYPNGTILANIEMVEGSQLLCKVATARALGHPVLVVADGQRLRYIGLVAP